MMPERKPRVLGVDDSLTIRKALEIVLKPAGYDLELAVDGADALAKAKSFKPDVILLDFILPDMRGSEVCQHLALDPETAHIPVILVSAKGAEIRQAYRDARNVVSYIAKPFKPQVVTGIVAEVLAKTAAGEQVKAAVPVHEAEGLSIPPITAIPPSPVPTPPQLEQPQFAPPTPPPEAAPPGVFAAPPSPVQRPARPRAISRSVAPRAPIAEAAATELRPAFASEAERREALDLIFESLRSSTEGVYVEEVDTPLGAAVDQAKSYIQILEALGRELAEGLQHARSGAKYWLYGDGSVRSFDESLFEIFRRTCRLVFRATSAGAVAHEPGFTRPRVLVVCSKGSAVHRQLPALVAAHPDWQLFHVTEGFRQLPLVARLFGPSIVFAEVTWSGALWDQLAVLARLPEMETARIIGIAGENKSISTGPQDEPRRAAAVNERRIEAIVSSLFAAEALLAEPKPASALEGNNEGTQAPASSVPSPHSPSGDSSWNTL